VIDDRSLPSAVVWQHGLHFAKDSWKVMFRWCRLSQVVV
jgi:hypothetical protein